VSAALLATLLGCYPDNNLQIQTATAVNVSTSQAKLFPLGNQQVNGYVVSASSGAVGSVTQFSGQTSAANAGSLAAWNEFGIWPTTYQGTNFEMPAEWSITWDNPGNCHSQSPPYAYLPSAYTEDYELTPGSGLFPQDPTVVLECFQNTPESLDFPVNNMVPQFSLDDATPATMQVVATLPITAPSSITNLRVLGTDFSNPATVTATSVAGNGASALFTYPRQSNGTSLPSGVYIAMLTTDPTSGPQTSNGVEPFYIGHDDTTWPSAFGVADATPKTVTVTGKLMANPNGPAICTTMTTTQGGTPIPLVTLLTQSALAVGSPTKTVAVGANPTVVIPFNDVGSTKSIGNPACPATVTTYSGAQSALVVNTGGNSVSVVSIGTEFLPSGTVSEVNLSSLQQTRTIAVMMHPSSITFDKSGNLWVGGQGSIMNISIPAWSVASTSPVNGTITGMNYDASTSLLVETTIQNGSVATPRAEATGSALVAFSSTPQISYSTQNTFSTATGVTNTSNFAGDNAAYATSTAASYLAFPAQSAVSTPIYTASDGDIAATVNGTSFTVFIVPTNQVVIAGTLPHPARGVSVTSSMVYFTMPESNSLVSLPIRIP
jgi:hypothetical protein